VLGRIFSTKQNEIMKWIRYFILSAGAILLAAALSRFLIAAGSTQVLALPDPMLGIPLRYAVLAVGALELVVALICLFGRRVGLQIGWLAWLGANYIVFGIGLVWQHCPPKATCIGSLTDPLRIYHGTPGYILEFIPLCLALGSYAAAVSFWFSAEGRTARLAETRQFAAQHDSAAGLMKMVCPACGGHVKFAAQNAGQQIPCPHCQAAITLRQADENLKMTCVLCGGHIEFPPHAVGQKIPCPHCAKSITLLKPA
jgi:DNA-directed RNA polymerase subunit RPC12/RpoP